MTRSSGLLKFAGGLLIALVILAVVGPLFHAHGAGSDCEPTNCAVCVAAELPVLAPPAAIVAVVEPAPPPRWRTPASVEALPAGAPQDRPAARGPPCA